MNKEVFNQEHILFDASARTQEEAFAVIAEFVHSLALWPMKPNILKA
ncbi:hypothetical protein N568_0106075 [Lactococcus garvieae TRF1]|uniref:Uncharacterized protein n=1 Tax=Lactococcus garvieae TRF1 TaxID=1380772 RepID=V8AP81_9LACT|nr:hypothetical protein N568_0106075 [Lactococcus garvieae TRF1]